MLLDYLIVVTVTLLAGAWSIPIGILLGLPAGGVYVASVAGSVAYTAIVLILVGRARDLVFERWFPTVEERVMESRATLILARWGTPGLAVVGGVLLGPSVTLAAALLLNVPRRTFAAWYVATTFVGFGLLTLFWQWVLG